MMKSQRTKDLETLIVLALALTVLARLFVLEAAEAAAFLLLIVALLMPKTASHITAFWMKFGTFLGRINSKILLTVIFYTVLTPLAFFYRLFSGKDNLRLKKDPATESFWHKRDWVYGKEDFEKSW